MEDEDDGGDDGDVGDGVDDDDEAAEAEDAESLVDKEEAALMRLVDEEASKHEEAEDAAPGKAGKKQEKTPAGSRRDYGIGLRV